MENLIARKCHPVLIDVETLIHPQEHRSSTNNNAKRDFFEKDSIIASGFLPIKKRQEQTLDFSALHGTKQKIPFKVPKLTNEDTSNVKYQLEEDYLNAAQNIPLLNDAPVPYHNHVSHIIVGYQEMILVLYENKTNLSQSIHHFFKHFLNSYLKRQQILVT